MPLDTLTGALDDVQWEEKKHPRDKSGQFTSGTGSQGPGAELAKKGEVSHSVAAPLLMHGFKLKSETGEATYVHEHGHEIHVGPTAPGESHSPWHDPKTGAKGVGGSSLKSYLSAKGVKFPKSKTKVGWGVAAQLLLNGYQLKPGGQALYQNSAGQQIVVKPAGDKYSSSWEDPNTGAKGEGSSSLKAYVSSGKAPAQAAGTAPKSEPKPGPAFSHPAASIAAKIAKHGGVPTKETQTLQSYSFPGGTKLSIKKQPLKYGTYTFKVTSPGGTESKGKGLTQLGMQLQKHEPVAADVKPPPGASKDTQSSALIWFSATGYEAVDVFTASTGEKVYISKSSDAWKIHDPKTWKTTQGEGQAALNSAFEALHRKRQA